MYNLNFSSHNKSWLTGFLKDNFPKYLFLDFYGRFKNKSGITDNCIIYLDDEAVNIYHFFIESSEYFSDKKIILICKIKEVYDKLSSHGYSCLYYPYWHIVDDAIAMKKLLEFMNVTPIHNRDYSFCCLNRRKSPYRDQTIEKLIMLDLIKYGYVTYVYHDHVLNPLNGVQMQPPMGPIEIVGEVGQERHNHQLNNIDYSSTVANYFFIQKNISAAINISVETTMQPFFPTEKSFLGFFTKKIPIVLAEPNRMSELETEGFDIFRDYVNHSYDLLLDPMERITRALIDNRDLLTQFDADVTNRVNANFDFLLNEWLDRKLIELFNGINELI